VDPPARQVHGEIVVAEGELSVRGNSSQTQAFAVAPPIGVDGEVQPVGERVVRLPCRLRSWNQLSRVGVGMSARLR